MIRAVNNTILARPRPDLHALLCKFASSGEEIDSAIFGKVRIDSTVSYDVTSKPNNFALAEVLSIGRGPAWMDPRYRPKLEPGSIIGFDLAAVSHAHPFEGETLYMMPLDAAVCRFDVGARLPCPIGGWMMTEEDPASLRRFQLRDRKSALILPDSVMKAGIKTNDRTWSRVTIAVEKVIGVGTGGYAIADKALDRVIGWKEKSDPVRDAMGRVVRTDRWREPVFEKERTLLIPEPEAVGMVAVFMPVMSIDLYAYGVRHRFSPWDRVRELVRWGPADAREVIAKPRESAA